MNEQKTLSEHALFASRHGDYRSARYLFDLYAAAKRWCGETKRARWDGAAALLSWWQGLETEKRPSLDRLYIDDAQAFIDWLEQQNLARSTIKGYKVGAGALSKAIRAARGPGYTIDDSYEPFKCVHLSPRARTVPMIDEEALAAITNPKVRAKLGVLLALLRLGLSIPEACSRDWKDLEDSRILRGYGARRFILGAEALTALEELDKQYPNQHLYGFLRILRWKPDTARKWLKELRQDERGFG